jgi:hypothetical protein
MLANFSHETLTLPKSTVLGVAEEVSEELVDRINKPEQTSLEPPTRARRKRKNEALYNNLWRETGPFTPRGKTDNRAIVTKICPCFPLRGDQ